MDTAKQFEEKLARIYQAIGSDKPSVLARVLDIKPPSITAAQKRKQIPGGWVEIVAEQCDVSADWLLFGIGEMKPSQAVLPAPDNQENFLDSAKKFEALTIKYIELSEENRQLWKENTALREKVAALGAERYRRNDPDRGQTSGVA